MDRGKTFLSRIQNELFMLNKKTLQSLTTLGDADVSKIATDNVVYEEIENVAVISIDGAMAKKTVQGLCMSVYGYDTIAQHLTVAEQNESIDTVIFRVDTPGGHVAGADDLEDRIFKSSLNTITIYENVGASAGVYVFSASDKIFATKTTEVGSIGVLATVPISKDEPTHMAIVSQNAENKVCDMEAGCFDRIQAKINIYEEMFINTVSKNTGMTKDEIVTGFNNGETIFAKDALDIGFLDGIKTFHELLNETVTTGTIPTAASDKIANTQKRTAMTTEELLAQVQTLTEERDTLSLQVEGFSDTQEAAVTAAVEKAVLEANTNTLNTAVTRVTEAFEYGADKSTVIAMIEASDDDEASKILLNAEKTESIGGNDGAQSGTTEKEMKAKSMLEFAKAHKGSVR